MKTTDNEKKNSKKKETRKNKQINPSFFLFLLIKAP